MNDTTAVENQLSDSESHYSATQPFTNAQWEAIQALQADFATLDAVLIQNVPHSEAQSDSRELLKASHEQALASLMEHWVEPEAMKEVREPEPEPEDDGAADES